MAFPRLDTESFRMARPHLHAEPTKRPHQGRRGVRRPTESKLTRRDGTTLRAPFTIEDAAGHKLAEIALHTREDGSQATRLRLFSLDGHPTVTVLGDEQGGVVGVHGPGSDRAALLIHADAQGGLLQIRNGAGKTVVELPADLPLPAAVPQPWWKFWRK